MKEVWSRLQGHRTRPATPDLRGWLAMFLVMAFTAAAVLHVSEGAFSSASASNQHGFGEILADAGDSPCIPDEDGLPHAAVCGTGSNCADIGSIASALFSRPPAKEPDEMAASAVEFGDALSPHERPPRCPQSA